MVRTRKPRKASAGKDRPAPAPAAEGVWVVFVRAHTHRDTPYTAGDRIAVSESEAELLRRFDAVEVG